MEGRDGAVGGRRCEKTTWEEGRGGGKQKQMHALATSNLN
jgi:hypothetical protein